MLLRDWLPSWVPPGENSWGVFESSKAVLGVLGLLLRETSAVVEATQLRESTILAKTTCSHTIDSWDILGHLGHLMGEF